MSNRTSKDFLSDIQEATRRVKVYTTGMTYEAFLADTRTQDAVIRILAKQLKTYPRNSAPDIRIFLGKVWLELGIG